MAAVRPPAVAGSFYPRDAQTLRATVHEHLNSARGARTYADAWPKALIVPHAGFVYSGPVAAPAYLSLEPGAEIIHRVVLIGPSHRVAFEGLALPSHAGFATPLGRVPVDETSRRHLLTLPFVQTLDEAHQDEHALEVQLPFLQEIVPTFSILPVVVGRATPHQVAEVLERVWGGDETVVVVSSDLSHYHGYTTAQAMDAATADAIERLQPDRIGHDDACGRIAIQGLLQVAAAQSLTATRLDLRNSGDTAGGRREVVGYGAWALTT